ncbi:hypothetical protein FFLO_05229 [Filobasidium floriforme]|uniref:Uncharacterized protein n=1 Tax=Filobasidium floriforme TaxID=5210 RepID=A0A8K0JHB1_9TREE|nr:hypothetical protein FFLO_05229 [Filobasidium floriforme]
MGRDEIREKTITILRSDDAGERKHGVEAHIIIHMGRWEDYREDIAPNGAIQRWLHQIYRHVWSSLTAAGDQISSAKTYEVVPDEVWDDWVVHRPILAIFEDRIQCSDPKDITKNIPDDRPIVIVLVTDEGTPGYYSTIEKRKNIVTSHHIHYLRPVFFDSDSDVEEIFPNAEDQETFYTDGPGKWYYKSFRSAKPLPEKRKIVIEPRYTIVFPHFDALPLERPMPPSRKMSQVEKLARFRVSKNLRLSKSGTTLHVLKSPTLQRDDQDPPNPGHENCYRTSRNDNGVVNSQILCAKYGLRFLLIGKSRNTMSIRTTLHADASLGHQPIDIDGISVTMPAQHGKQMKYERVEQDRDVAFDGMKVYVFIQLGDCGQWEFAYDDIEPLPEWTKLIRERVWLSLLQAGQPVSSVTWIVNDSWATGHFASTRGDVKKVAEDDYEGWAKSHMPRKTPIIVVDVTDTSCSRVERALDDFSNVFTFHKLMYERTSQLDESTKHFLPALDTVYTSIPASYFECRKSTGKVSRAVQQGGPAH